MYKERNKQCRAPQKWDVDNQSARPTNDHTYCTVQIIKNDCDQLSPTYCYRIATVLATREVVRTVLVLVKETVCLKQ